MIGGITNLNQIVLESSDCLGVLDGKKVACSSLNAACVILTSFGAKKVLVPTPGEFSKEQFRRGYDQLPKERRRLVEKIDSNGKIFSLVETYLHPLKKQAKKWPETAFVSFSLSTLYKLLVASKHVSSVCESNLTEILRLIPGMSSGVFKGEARYRFAEICHILAAFDPYEVRGLTVAGKLDQEKRMLIIDVLKSAQFRTIQAEMGKLGYVRKPRMSLELIWQNAKKLASNKKFAAAIKTGALASELPGSPLNVSAVGDIIEEKWSSNGYVCPVLDLPTGLEYEIFVESLAAVAPEAVPPKGTIMVMSSPSGHSWLNLGEEGKLTYNSKEALIYKQKATKSAREYLLRYIPR